MIKVRCYVDGLNFYHGVARPYNCQWVDLQALLRALLRQRVPDAEVERVILFTAPLAGGGAAARQRVYFHALQAHCPNLELVLGHFRTSIKQAKLLKGPEAGQFREVAIREEKRSDVNLACRMVADAYTVAGKEFDAACLVSNDADMAAALEVTRQLRQRTMLITPRATHGDSFPSGKLRELVATKDSILTIKEGLVRRCRLPNRVGKWRCPNAPGWRA